MSITVKPSNKLARAFTLVEVLIVCLIVALLAALVFRVVGSAKGAAKRTTCVEQLRQIGMAVSMYETDNGAEPKSLQQVAAQIGTKELFLCPDDPVGGFATRCDTNHPPTATTYETMLTWADDLTYKKALEKLDPNHGIVVCRVHGEHTVDYAKAMRNLCAGWRAIMYQGALNRLRKDGSVQLAHYSLQIPSLIPPHRIVTGLSVWSLYTDVPEPWRLLIKK